MLENSCLFVFRDISKIWHRSHFNGRIVRRIYRLNICDGGRVGGFINGRSCSSNVQLLLELDLESHKLNRFRCLLRRVKNSVRRILNVARLPAHGSLCHLIHTFSFTRPFSLSCLEFLCFLHISNVSSRSLCLSPSLILYIFILHRPCVGLFEKRKKNVKEKDGIVRWPCNFRQPKSSIKLLFWACSTFRWFMENF